LSASAPIASLRQALGVEAVRDDIAERIAYSYDNSRMQALPEAVVFAHSHDEVVKVVHTCREARTPLVVRGRGTNTTGASVPTEGGIVLSLEGMQRILDYRPADRLLVCEAGTLNGAVQEQAAADGLFWAPDPTSTGYSTVGGNIACGAGGPRAVKYGTTREALLGLRAVDGHGETLICGCRTSKGVVGYDLTRLLVGSEGTLAIVTEATLRLLPRPSARRDMRAAFSDVNSAAAAVTRIMGQAAIPCALELMDEQCVALAQAHTPLDLPAGTGALLLLSADGDEASIANEIAAIARAAEGDGLLEWRAAADEADAASVWGARKALSPALRSLAPKKINEDVAVPVSRLAELLAGLREQSARHGLQIVNFGHAGNGNIHVNILADPDDPSQMAAIDACLDAVFTLVLSLGGTLSGEHGVGVAKRDFVAREIDATTLARMRDIKRLFDPDGILNPGKTLPAAPGGKVIARQATDHTDRD
jgi:D-lactate dehydrogenase